MVYQVPLLVFGIWLFLQLTITITYLPLYKSRWTLTARPQLLLAKDSRDFQTAHCTSKRASSNKSPRWHKAWKWVDKKPELYRLTNSRGHSVLRGNKKKKTQIIIKAEINDQTKKIETAGILTFDTPLARVIDQCFETVYEKASFPLSFARFY